MSRSMFDNYFGGKVSSRAAMQDKIRNLQTTGSVIQETIQAVESVTPAELISGREEIARKRKWQVVASGKSAPFLGDAFVISSEQNS